MQYLLIKNAIEEQIESGMFDGGQKLPSERILAETFATTRITLREALHHLALSGKIYKEERRGWFVSPSALVFDPVKHIDISYVCQKQKKTYQKISLSSHRLLASKEMLSILKLPPFSYVRQFVSLIHIDGRKVAVQYRYIPEEMAIALNGGEESDLLTELRAHFGYESRLHEVEVGIKPASKFESDTLNLSTGSLLLSIHQVACNNRQSPLLLQTLACCHDAIQVKINSFTI